MSGLLTIVLAAVALAACGGSGGAEPRLGTAPAPARRAARALVVQGGINDIAQGRPVGAAARDLGAMVRAGRERGLRVTLVEVLPWNNGYPGADPQIRALNGLIRRLGREERVRVLPWYERLEDPRAPGRMRRDLTSDGSHPSIRGYRILARDLPAPRP